jgi:peptidoglycan/LPS O-acetylase OafA/YrhL
MKKIRVLESVRGLAAVYVLLHHLFDLRLATPPKFAFFFRFGQEAVMLFFLLSGFVIYYSFSKQPQQTFKDYFRRRALRVFPIYLLSLLVTYAVACLNYHTWTKFDDVLSYGHLFMLQDLGGVKPGVWFSSAGNSALWSLSYEWWFYMLFFPIFRFVPENWQRWAVASLALLGFVIGQVFPSPLGYYLNYFIIWWTGVEVARAYVSGIKPSLLSLKTPLLLLAFFVVLQGINVFLWKAQHKPLSFGLHPFLELRHFAFSLAVLLVALCLSPSAWKNIDKVLAPFSLFAPISYALYVFHLPLCVGAKYLSFIGSPLVELFLYLAILFGAAYMAEIPMQRAINRWSKRFN